MQCINRLECQNTAFARLHTATSKEVTRIVYTSQNEYIVTACKDGQLRAYSAKTEFLACRILGTHTPVINDMLHLDKDVVITAGWDGRLCIWCITDERLVYTWKHKRSIKSIAKLSTSEIVIGDVQGDLIILSHRGGMCFAVTNHITKAHSSCISDISVDNNSIVTCSSDGTAKVWRHTEALELITKLHEARIVLNVAANSEYIVTASRDKRDGPYGCNIHVYRSSRNHPLKCVLRYSEAYIYGMQFLNVHELAVLDSAGCVSILSLSSNAFRFKFKVATGVKLRSLAVLPDSRIAVSGSSGFSCIFAAPREILTLIDEHARILYSLASLSASRSDLANNTTTGARPQPR